MLKLQQIRKAFHLGTPTETVIFQNLNLSVQEGEFVTVIGGNGAGKTTLLNLISGHLFPEKGQIELAGKNVTREKEYHRANYISRVFQNPLLGTAPDLTIAENLTLATYKRRSLSLHRGLKKQEIANFKSLLAPLKVGLEERMDTPVKDLSGGQRQALTLLMATLDKPKILLLDEHTAALDPKTAQQVLELTQQLVLTKQLTTLMVTHNLEQAIRYGNRLLMLHQGEIICDVSGAEKESLTTEKLLAKFHETAHIGLVEDRLLLA